MRWRSAAAVLAVAAATVGAGIFGWVKVDPARAVPVLCGLGLPNFSKPPGVDTFDIGCTPVGPRQRYEGLLLTDFELFVLIPDYQRTDGQPSLDEAVWVTPTRQNDPLLEQFHAELSDAERRMCGRGAVMIQFDGWMAIAPGEYGHLGQYQWEVLLDRLVAVGPPSEHLVEESRSGFGTPEDCDARAEQMAR